MYGDVWSQFVVIFTACKPHERIISQRDQSDIMTHTAATPERYIRCVIYIQAGKTTTETAKTYFCCTFDMIKICGQVGYNDSSTWSWDVSIIWRTKQSIRTVHAYQFCGHIRFHPFSFGCTNKKWVNGAHAKTMYEQINAMSMKKTACTRKRGIVH